MKVEWSRKAATVGGVLTIVMLVFVAFHANTFTGYVPYGNLMLVIAIVSALLMCPAIGVRWDTNKRIYGVLLLVFFLVVPLLMEIVIERCNGKFITEFYGAEDWLDNYNVILLLYLLLFAITGSVRASVMVVSPVLLLFGIANLYVKEFKGGPLLPQDFASIETAVNVASAYVYEIGYEIVFGVSLTGLIMAVASRLKMPERRKKLRGILRIICVLVIGIYAGIFYGTDTFAKIGYRPDFFNQTRGYERHGAVMEFTLNTKYLWLNEPKGYGDADIRELVHQYDGEDTPHILETALVRQGASPEDAAAAVSVETAGARGERPNIIVVMNESLADLRVDGEFEASEEFMPFYDSLTENTIKGNAYVSVFGSGTSNTEYEFLTGNSMAFMPAGSNAYQAFVTEEQPGLTTTLLEQGYSADAFHPYNRSSWNRTNVYKAMGFSSFITIEDLIDNEILQSYRTNGNDYMFIRRVESHYPDENMLLRKYVSDDYDFRKVIEMYENRNAEQPFYLFNVTMQNHSPYDRTFANFDETIRLTSPAGDYRKVDQYLSLVKVTDDDFRNLTEYFKQQSEPTIILMFGDHQPYVESEFYSEVMGQPVTEMDEETLQNRYITNFVLWANYPIPSGRIDAISVNYLSTLLLQVAGLEMTDYNRYLAHLYQDLPVVTGVGCIDRNGQFLLASNDDDESEDIIQEMRDYRYIAYNNVANIKDRERSVFYVGS